MRDQQNRPPLVQDLTRRQRNAVGRELGHR
jgi:hypothetical protein